MQHLACFAGNAQNPKKNPFSSLISKNRKIKKFIIVKDPFTIDNGFMTPSMKLKRNQIIKKYETELEALY